MKNSTLVRIPTFYDPSHLKILFLTQFGLSLDDMMTEIIIEVEGVPQHFLEAPLCLIFYFKQFLSFCFHDFKRSTTLMRLSFHAFCQITLNWYNILWVSSNASLPLHSSFVQYKLILIDSLHHNSSSLD